MLYYLKSSWIWLKRCTHSRGFGVQSPSAYRFIRYVINEHYPYYAYDDLKKHVGSLSQHEQKMGRLFFRLANFWQPASCYCDNPQLLEFALAGSRKMRTGKIIEFLSDEHFLASVHHANFLDNKSHLSFNEFHASYKSRSALSEDRILIWVDADSAVDVLDGLLPKCTSQTLLVVDGMQRKKHVLWKKIQESNHVGITYHLYYCGIVFFDKSVYKQHYEVNF